MSYREGTDTRIKQVDGYSVKEVGDRVGGLFGKYTNKNLYECKEACDKKGGCVGFSYKVGECELKKDDGLATTYSSTGKQFYTNDAVKPTQEEVFWMNGGQQPDCQWNGYGMTRAQAKVACEQIGTRLATEDEQEEARQEGGVWCAAGWNEDSPTAVFPSVEGTVGGCGGGYDGLVRWNPMCPDGNAYAGAVCYGVKPGPGVLPSEGRGSPRAWNSAKWSKYD